MDPLTGCCDPTGKLRLARCGRLPWRLDNIHARIHARHFTFQEKIRVALDGAPETP